MRFLHVIALDERARVLLQAINILVPSDDRYWASIDLPKHGRLHGESRESDRDFLTSCAVCSRRES